MPCFPGSRDARNPGSGPDQRLFATENMGRQVRRETLVRGSNSREALAQVEAVQSSIVESTAAPRVIMVIFTHVFTPTRALFGVAPWLAKLGTLGMQISMDIARYAIRVTRDA